MWPVGNKDCPSDQSWDLSLGIPRDVYHPPSLQGCIRAGNKSLSDSRLSSSDWEHYQPHHQPSVSLCPPPPSPGPCTGLSMPQLKLHSSQSSFQDNKFDARRSSLCAGVFTQICRCRGAAGRRLETSVWMNIKIRNMNINKNRILPSTLCKLYQFIVKTFI